MLLQKGAHSIICSVGDVYCRVPYETPNPARIFLRLTMLRMWFVGWLDLAELRAKFRIIAVLKSEMRLFRRGA